MPQAYFSYGSNAMKKKDGRGMPGGMGAGASGMFGPSAHGPGTKRRVSHKKSQSKGGGNRRGGIGSGQVKMAHNRHKMNNQKVISAMRKS